MKIGICNDHAGVEYKFKLIKYLKGKGYEVVNFGTDTTDSCDYADFAHLVKSHNLANVLVMPARFVSYRMAVSMVREWLTAEFEGGRHERRIAKIPIK